MTWLAERLADIMSDVGGRRCCSCIARLDGSFFFPPVLDREIWTLPQPWREPAWSWMRTWAQCSLIRVRVIGIRPNQ